MFIGSLELNATFVSLRVARAESNERRYLANIENKLPRTVFKRDFKVPDELLNTYSIEMKLKELTPARNSR